MDDRQLIINNGISETRIAVLEEGKVAEIYIERHRHRGLVGNIYKGKITRVLPGMQSAFIDIGSERSAFLFGGDVFDPNYYQIEKDQIEVDDSEDPRNFPNKTPIEKILKEGQEIVVQVTKEPMGKKGARVTMFLAIPGRYVVLMSDVKNLAISRRIENPSERERLKAIVKKKMQHDYGFIIRTAAEHIDEKMIVKDMQYLGRIWQTVKKKRSKCKAPSVLFQEADISLKITRDLYSGNVSKIVVDEKSAYNKIKQFLDTIAPGASSKLELYQKAEPIFDDYDIEMDIAKALNRKVWLPSGGYLVIDQTEALTAFDVNTGKFVGHLSAQDTIFQTNMEAVGEIAWQLRLRNIGGIIIIDFIDMERERDREKVYRALEKALKPDKAKTHVLPISELGIVQLTRKRTTESLERILLVTCPCCQGRGRIPGLSTESYNLVRDLERYHLQTGAKHLSARARTDIREYLTEQEPGLLKHLKAMKGITVKFIDSNVSLSILKDSPYEIFAE